MYKRTVKYEDFDGNQREEDLYFNLTEAETIKWLTTNGDYTLDQLLRQLVKERKGKEIIKCMEELIQSSYGVKSLDGRKFDKSPEVVKDFIQTEAYSIILTELLTDSNKAADFVNRIIPKKMSDNIAKMVKEHPESIPEEARDYISSFQEVK